MILIRLKWKVFLQLQNCLDYKYFTIYFVLLLQKLLISESVIKEYYELQVTDGFVDPMKV